MNAGFVGVAAEFSALFSAWHYYSVSYIRLAYGLVNRKKFGDFFVPVCCFCKNIVTLHQFKRIENAMRKKGRISVMECVNGRYFSKDNILRFFIVETDIDF